MKNLLLTQEELSKHLQVSIVTLYRWRKEGLPCIKAGKQVRYKLDEVYNWLNNKNAETGEEQTEKIVDRIMTAEEEKKSLVKKINLISTRLEEAYEELSNSLMCEDMDQSEIRDRINALEIELDTVIEETKEFKNKK